MEGFFAFLGVHSFNVSKTSAGYATDIVAWGLGINTATDRVYYTAPRRKRLADKLRDGEFDRDWPGDVCFKKLRSLHGSMRNMQSTLRPVRAHFRAVSWMLSTTDPMMRIVSPKGDADEVRLAWARFHDAIDQLRVLIDDEKFWAPERQPRTVGTPEMTALTELGRRFFSVFFFAGKTADLRHRFFFCWQNGRSAAPIFFLLAEVKKNTAWLRKS